MRRLLFIVPVGVLAALVMATPALAAPGCGNGWDLMTVADTIDRVDERIYDDAEWAEIVALVESVDANGDGWMCSKQFKPNHGQDKQWIGPEDVGVHDYVVTALLDNKANGRGE